MRLAGACRTVVTSTAVACIAVAAFVLTNLAMAQSETANNELLTVLQKKAEAGDPAAQFSLGLKIALSRRL